MIFLHAPLSPVHILHVLSILAFATASATRVCTCVPRLSESPKMASARGEDRRGRPRALLTFSTRTSSIPKTLPGPSLTEELTTHRLGDSTRSESVSHHQQRRRSTRPESVRSLRKPVAHTLQRPALTLRLRTGLQRARKHLRANGLDNGLAAHGATLRLGGELQGEIGCVVPLCQ